jgi:iron-sulfur cluster assembly protein
VFFTDHLFREIRMISCTAKAAARLRCQLLKDTTTGHPQGIHIGVRPTGCSGLSYAIEVCDLTALPAGAEVFESEGLSLVVTKKDQPFLAGTQLDFARDGLAERFTFNNPNETARCGCGESFRV